MVYLGRSIVDESGEDRTDYVLEKRKPVGTPPQGYTGHLRAERLTVGRALLSAVLVGLVVLGAYSAAAPRVF